MSRRPHVRFCNSGEVFGGRLVPKCLKRTTSLPVDAIEA